MTAIPAVLKARIPLHFWRLLSLFGSAFVVAFAWHPEGLAPEGWRLFVFFITTIFAIIIKPLPMGAISFLALSILAATKTVSLPTLLSGFSNDLIWLIVMACFLAKSFIKTGLGKRLAFSLINLCGGHPLGLSYGIALSSCITAPLVPSTVARAGGVLLPAVHSIIDVLDFRERKALAPFLLLSAFHSIVITSAMFLTASVSNPIIAKLATSVHVDLNWCFWAKAAIVPGLTILLLMPLILKKVLNVTLDASSHIGSFAKEQLQRLGPTSNREKLTIMVFGLLLLLWAFGRFINVSTTESALFGVGLLLSLRILKWDDIISERVAWDTFFWVATLVTIAGELDHHGVIQFFINKIHTVIPAGPWMIQLLLISLVYFYSHYFFASMTAHVTSMFCPFLLLACAHGAPATVATLLLAAFSSLFGGLTHYASSAAPLFFARDLVDVKTWWRVGFFLSLFYIVTWTCVGLLWWKLLGLF